MRLCSDCKHFVSTAVSDRNFYSRRLVVLSQGRQHKSEGDGWCDRI